LQYNRIKIDTLTVICEFWGYVIHSTTTGAS